MPRPTTRDLAIGACATSALVHAWLAAVHLDERLLAASFAAASVALAAAGLGLSANVRLAPLVATALFAALLVTYPVVTSVGGERFDALGIATKLVETVGLVAAIGCRRQAESFGSADALVGVTLGVLLLSLGHAH